MILLRYCCVNRFLDYVIVFFEFPDELVFLWENKIVNTVTNMFSFIQRYNRTQQS